MTTPTLQCPKCGSDRLVEITTKEDTVRHFQCQGCETVYPTLYPAQGVRV